MVRIYFLPPPAASETFTRLLTEIPTAGGYVFGTSGDEEFFKIVQTINCAFTISSSLLIHCLL